MPRIINIDVTAAASLGDADEVAIEAAAQAAMAIFPDLEPIDGEPGSWLRLESPTVHVHIDIQGN